MPQSLASSSIKAFWNAGKPVVQGWCSIPSTVTSEMVARAGFDTVVVDLQHGLVDYQGALPMLQTIDCRGIPALARVPSNEPGIIAKMLDAGFTGIICPMVNTRAEAEALGRACRYAPRGERSFGPTRASQVFGASYAVEANDHIAVIAMIETARAVENVEDIMACREIDAAYIGPSDLSLSLGFAPTLEPKEPLVLDAIARIKTAARAAGKRVGIHCGSPGGVKAMLAQGFDFATLSTDVRLFTSMIESLREECMAGLARR